MKYYFITFRINTLFALKNLLKDPTIKLFCISQLQILRRTGMDMYINLFGILCIHNVNLYDVTAFMTWQETNIIIISVKPIYLYSIVGFCKNATITITRKKFSEKTIVAFTNSTVFILDSVFVLDSLSLSFSPSPSLSLYMTKPVWSHVLAFSAWTLKKTHIVSCQEA